MTPIQKMKSELKTMAAMIRADNAASKAHHRKVSAYDAAHPDWAQGGWHSAAAKERRKVLYDSPQYQGGDSRAFRLKHIVYCLARGRKYEEIEPRVRDENKLGDDLLAKLKTQAKAVHDEQEALRLGA